MNHLVWAEIRCDRQNKDGCHEGLEGRWISDKRDIRAMISDAAKCGWDVSSDNTVCPKCRDLTSKKGEQHGT